MRAFYDAQAGKLPEFPAIEWYIHTTVDPSLRDEAGRHNAALFVQWVPYSIAGTSWDAEEPAYVLRSLATPATDSRRAPASSSWIASRCTPRRSKSTSA